MLTEDELPEEAKRLSVYWMDDPKTGKKVKPRRWVHDPTTGEFYRLLSLQPSGPELARIPYAQRVEYRITQERALYDKIKNNRFSALVGTVALVAALYFCGPMKVTLSYIPYVFAFFALLLVLWSAKDITSAYLTLRNENKLVEIGPRPIKKFNFDFPLHPVDDNEAPPLPLPEKKTPWDVRR